MFRFLLVTLLVSESSATSLRAERLQTAQSPCECQADTSSIPRPQRTQPRCIFIDLGAADGNSYNMFLNGEYGQISDCPNQEYEAYLVEANPHFETELNNKAATSVPGKEIYIMMNGAWMCEADTTFHVTSAASSLAPQGNAEDVKVHLINTISLIKSKTIPGDKVLLKVDIEGAEFDIIPCLAQSDVLSPDMTAFVEEHYFLGGVKRSLTHVKDKDYKAAKEVMISKGVKMPHYSSLTLLSNLTDS
ncbi:SKIV2L2 [Symbiodinium pilosum]|uniref:SKIV2L2 protein n=1 Tax=Symbiodinium pilosum TaxID=2952 RepID=A0A812XXW8_SYMPI|nr:SKIV2L2 [Symbiodinium pilosum]